MVNKSVIKIDCPTCHEAIDIAEKAKIKSISPHPALDGDGDCGSSGALVTDHSESVIMPLGAMVM